MKKKYTMHILASVLVLALLSGCGGGAGNAATVADNDTQHTADSDSSEQLTSGDETTIVVALMSNDWLDAAAEIAAAFTEAYGVTVDYIPMPGEVEEFLQPRAAGGTLPDVMSINAGPFGALLADNDMLIDLSDTDAARNMLDSLKPVFTSPTGRLFGIAGGLSTTLIYYNKEMFAEAGITEHPTSWEEFIELNHTLQDHGMVPLVLAMGDGAIANTAWSTGNAVEIAANNPDYITQVATGAFNFDTPEQARIFERISILMDYGFLAPGSVSNMHPVLPEIFFQEQAAMCFQGIWMAGVFVEDSPFDVGMMIPPWNMEGQTQGVVLGTETGFGAAAGPNEQAAIDFINFVNAGEGFYIYQQARGSIPSLIDFDSSRIRMSDVVQEYVDRVLQVEVTGAYWFEFLPPDVSANLPTLFQQVATGEITSEEAAGIMQDLYLEN